MKLKLTVKCRNCENWTRIEMDVMIGVEIHLGCANCGHNVGTFVALGEGEHDQ